MIVFSTSVHSWVDRIEKSRPEADVAAHSKGRQSMCTMSRVDSPSGPGLQGNINWNL